MALVLAPEQPLAEWIAALDAQIARAPAFFDSRPVILDLAGLPREQPDVTDLIGAIAGRGIRIIGTEGAHPAWRDIERWGGPLATGAKNGAREMQVPDERRPGVATQAASTANLVFDQPIRSGQ